MITLSVITLSGFHCILIVYTVSMLIFYLGRNWQDHKTGNVGMFDTVLFDNYLDLVQQCKNRSFFVLFFHFLDTFLVHKKSKFELIELNPKNDYVRLKFCSTFFLHDTGRTKH